MNKYIILLLVISLFSCEKKKSSKTNQAKTTVSELKEVKETAVEAIEKVEKTVQETKAVIKPVVVEKLSKEVNFGKVKVSILEKGGKIQVSSNNEFSEKFALSLKGDIETFIETDVDGNGFNEFYIVSNSGDLAAFSSYNNKSFGKVNVAKKPFDFYADCTRVKFWEAKNKKLAITFENGTGELNTVRYKLKKGEASYQLIAE